MHTKRAEKVDRVACPGCSELIFASGLDCHFFHSKECDPVQTEVGVAPPGRPSARAETRELLFTHEYTRRVVEYFEDLHWKKFVPVAGWVDYSEREKTRLTIIESYILDELRAISASARVLASVQTSLATVRRVSASHRSEKRVKEYALGVQRIPHLGPFSLDSAMVGKKWRRNAASLSLTSLIVRQLQWSRVARRQTLARSTDFKTGKYYKQTPRVLSCISEGEKVRWSWVMQKSTNPREVRMLLQLHVDDVTLVNAIGTKKGEHKYNITRAANLNLDPSERFKWQNLLMLSVVNAKITKDTGMSYLLCGVDKYGVHHFDGSHAAEFRALEEGIEVFIPDDETVCQGLFQKRDATPPPKTPRRGA